MPKLSRKRSRPASQVSPFQSQIANSWPAHGALIPSEFGCVTGRRPMWLQKWFTFCWKKFWDSTWCRQDQGPTPLTLGWVCFFPCGKEQRKGRSYETFSDVYHTIIVQNPNNLYMIRELGISYVYTVYTHTIYIYKYTNTYIYIYIYTVPPQNRRFWELATLLGQITLLFEFQWGVPYIYIHICVLIIIFLLNPCS